jgi:hypothetical protein
LNRDICPGEAGVRLDDTLMRTYPARGFRSTWVNLIAHSAPACCIFFVVPLLILRRRGPRLGRYGNE